MDHRGGRLQPPLLAAGQVADPPVEHAAEGELVGQLADAASGVATAQAVQAGEREQVLPRGRGRVQRQFLRGEPEDRPDPGSGAGCVQPVDPHRPGVRGHQSRGDPGEGGLARPVVPDQPGDLAGRDREVEAVERDGLAEPFDQAGCLEQGRHLLFLPIRVPLVVSIRI